jgi:hypothetical protein
MNKSSALRLIVAHLIVGMALCMMLQSKAGDYIALACWHLLWVTAIAYSARAILQLLLLVLVRLGRGSAQLVKMYA